MVKKGVWLKVGSIPIRPDLQTLPMKFIQDQINPEVLDLYNPNTVDIQQTTRESVLGLESAAVWEAEHVESRIKDYYEGKPNIWVKQLSLIK